MNARTQVEAAHNTVLAVPRLDTSALTVTGRDRLSWLNGLVTCDLAKRREGEAVYGLVVARNGRVLADAVVLVDEARVLLAVSAATVQVLRPHFDHYLVMEDAEVAPEAGGFGVWSLHGPRFAEVARAAQAAGAVAGELDRTGLGGAVLLAPREHAERVRAVIAGASEHAGGTVGDAGGWEVLRIERAVAEFGVDFDDKTYPQEAGLEKVAVSFDKGCYLGQEVVCMLEMRGHVKRRLAALVIDAGQAPPRGAPVTDAEGASVGEVTSAAMSPTLSKPIALAMVKRSSADPGSVILVSGARAAVVERPA
jgi:folate-binding protein YgfZ